MQELDDICIFIETPLVLLWFIVAQEVNIPRLYLGFVLATAFLNVRKVLYLCRFLVIIKFSICLWSSGRVLFLCGVEVVLSTPIGRMIASVYPTDFIAYIPNNQKYRSSVLVHSC